jgi:TRAP-type mannitol/chloroaromatic compound transport system permease large subunit
MMAFIAQNLAPIMFAGLVVVLLMGYPVAFSLGFTGLLFFFVGVELAPLSNGAITLDYHLLQSMPGRILDVMRNDVLLAVPFFTFMGLVLERSGMAEDLLETIGQLFGTLRGGLAFAVIFVGALLAATTGVVAASVIAMGLISLPIMLRYGYDRRLASGVIAASGTLAQIIPPSLVLIVLADQLGRSVDLMYKAALLPGLLLAACYAVYVLVVALLRPRAAPGLPPDALWQAPEGTRGTQSLAWLAALSLASSVWIISCTTYTGMDAAVLVSGIAGTMSFVAALASRLARSAGGLAFLSPLAERTVFVMMPPLLLIFLVLGTILIGLTTPTHGGAMGAVGAVGLAAMKRWLSGETARFNLAILTSAVEQTARLSAFVMFILIGARIFSLTFYGVNGHLWIEHLLTGLPGGLYGFLFFIMLVVFLLAFFLDFFELCFILVPLVKPTAEVIFRTSPEAVAIAKGLGLAVVAQTDATGVTREIVADITPLMVWFGVLLAVNMQTSFMHPPFGFALFFLRSVAPRTAYLDKVTEREIAPVTTAEIYWGAVPFVIIQLLMVAALIAMPSLVIKAPAPPPAIAHDINQPSSLSRAGSGFALPPSPPYIPGGPAPSPRDRGPTLDVSKPPVITP